MTCNNTTRNLVPLSIGIGLWAAATALLLEEAWHAQRFDVATLSVPVLTAATVCAAVLAHRAFQHWRIISAVMLLGLALLGSAVMVSGTLGRVAEAKDHKLAGHMASNRQFAIKSDDLKQAKAEQVRECRSGFGGNCQRWTQRVDALSAELAGMKVVEVDAKVAAIGNVAGLLGFDAERVKAIMAALDPVAVPLFLELGSIVLFGAALHRPRATVQQGSASVAAESVAEPFTREAALRDLRRLKEVGSQAFLAERWGVSRGTVSTWLGEFEQAGQVQRNRAGRSKALTVTGRR